MRTDTPHGLGLTQSTDGPLAIIAQQFDGLIEEFDFVRLTGRSVAPPQPRQNFVLRFLLISSCMSGNTDFWHNDLFTGIGHPFLGNNLFGAERSQDTAGKFLAPAKMVD
ncbi:MAG TPA: hypothetical protein VHI52_13675 [Verrucomicrobiae bacterium]|nr:hypothetical protein [Verrucomicrobiae bacterium]